MDLRAYLDHLDADLTQAAAAGGPDVVEAARRLAAALEPAMRMTLLEALSDAAAAITAELDDATVDIRLKGRDPQIVVQRLDRPAEEPPEGSGRESTAPPAPRVPVSATVEADDGDEPISRVTVRLPDSLKTRAEDLAAQRMQSLNSFILQAIAAAVAGRADGPEPQTGRAGRTRSPRRVQGWSR